ncbi:hypothetical protein PHJA_000565600 [Phtheirospermum japonicum]|uniref:DUF7787 domain-containing protein n=1 Tax=Phtheirospermum japonicum TaxID=374723 RepID=A0A830BFZ2_9LAMI|nr:hypothetical protein PHJA_000565600 [Phtheirospermum japonicum]
MMRKRESQKLAMEDYLDFIDNRALDLTSTQLRQIIGIHGFKKMKFQKNLSIEMISTMDLMDLRRSTLLDGGVSGDASFTLEEVIKDLKDLDWQECHVTSLLTQGAVAPPPAASSGSGAVSEKRKRGGETVAVNRETGGGTVSVKGKSDGGTVSVKRKRLKSLKLLGKKATQVGVDNSVVPASTLVAEGGTSEILSSLKCNSASVVPAGTTIAAGSTTEMLRSLACNSLAAVASPPIISLLTGRQLRRLLKSKNYFITKV